MIKLLDEVLVKLVLSKNDYKFKEFFIGKNVYGFYNKNKLVAMIPVSNNVELAKTRKIYPSLFLSKNKRLNDKILKALITEINNDLVLYVDCFESEKVFFERVGFNFRSKKENLKRYGTLHRGVLVNGN